MFHYHIFGLTVAAELPLPGAIALAQVPGEADIQVRLRPVPERLAAPVAHGPAWQLDARQFLLHLPGSGRFLASRGRTLDVEPQAAPEDIMPFVLGTGFAALLYQRGGMILHAATLERDGSGIAICGESGAGKSTLAAALCQHGCQLVGDDMAALALGPDLRLRVQPDGRCLKLFQGVIDRLGLAAGGVVRPGIDKHYVHPSATLGKPVRLDAVYVLRDTARSRAPGIERLPLLSAAQVLLNQSYRRRLALTMARHDPRGAEIRDAVMRHVPVFRFVRPRDMDRLAETTAWLLDHWRLLEQGQP